MYFALDHLEGVLMSECSHLLLVAPVKYLAEGVVVLGLVERVPLSGHLPVHVDAHVIGNPERGGGRGDREKTKGLVRQW